VRHRTVRPHAVRPDDGAVAVLTALVVTFVVIPLMAIVVDLGLARVVQQRAENAADSAALAAAMVGPEDAESLARAAAVAREYATRNTGGDAGEADWEGCTDPEPLPTTVEPCVSVDLERRLVRVVLPGTETPSALAGLMGRSVPVVSGSATAAWSPSGVDPACPLCASGPARIVE
jgi:Flp pilus assembly protein TadG